MADAVTNTDSISPVETWDWPSQVWAIFRQNGWTFLAILVVAAVIWNRSKSKLEDLFVNGLSAKPTKPVDVNELFAARERQQQRLAADSADDHQRKEEARKNAILEPKPPKKTHLPQPDALQPSLAYFSGNSGPGSQGPRRFGRPAPKRGG